MRACLIIFYFLIHTVVGMGQGVSPWDGYFEGEIIGIKSTLIGKAQDNQWTADLNAGGYLLALSGTITNFECSGTITDLQAKTTTPFTARLTPKQVTLRVRDVNPISGLEEDMEFIFTKGTPPPAPPPSLIEPMRESIGNADPKNHNQNLIGLWRYTDSYVSGDFSFATDYFIVFQSDGVVLVSDGRTAGGGPNSSIDSGQGDVHQGTWKTENKILWMNDGDSGWVNYAQFYVEGNNMMFTFANGKKQVWERL